MKKGVLILLFISSIQISFSQEVVFDVRSNNSNSVGSEKVFLAQNLKDLNTGYPTNWIRPEEYVSTKISIINKNDTLSSEGLNDIISPAQQSLLKKAGLNSEVEVEVKYTAKNIITALIDHRTMRFSFIKSPDILAEYTEGKEALRAYFKSNAIDKIAAEEIGRIIINFEINEQGEPSNIEVDLSSDDPELDQLLIDTISQMPKWKPAQFKNGTFAPQKFILSIGNSMTGC